MRKWLQSSSNYVICQLNCKADGETLLKVQDFLTDICGFCLLQSTKLIIQPKIQPAGRILIHRSSLLQQTVCFHNKRELTD